MTTMTGWQQDYNNNKGKNIKCVFVMLISNHNKSKGIFDLNCPSSEQVTPSSLGSTKKKLEGNIIK